MADTSFWVALFFERDAHHQEAESLWNGRGGPLLSTNHVLGETWTFMRRRGVTPTRFVWPMP